jgi:hypothetical protein
MTSTQQQPGATVDMSGKGGTVTDLVNQVQGSSQSSGDAGTGSTNQVGVTTTGKTMSSTLANVIKNAGDNRLPAKQPSYGAPPGARGNTRLLGR